MHAFVFVHVTSEDPDVAEHAASRDTYILAAATWLN